MRKLFLFFSACIFSIAASAQLNGTYSIDVSAAATAGNYLTVSDAISDMVSGVRADGGPVNGPGVSGPVTIRIAAGTGPYNEQLIIPAITGASAVNTIRLTGGAGRETITFAATLTGQRQVIKLNGARHIILDSLTLTNTGATYGYGVHITNSADSNVVSNCVVNVNPTATTSNFAGITISGATVTTSGDHGDANLILNNEINGGYYSVTMRGAGTASFNARNKVIGNTIQDFYYYGVYCYYQDSTLIIGNTISARTAATASGYGVYLNYVDRFQVENNRMFNLGGNGIYGSNANNQGGTGTARAKIINNMIGGAWVDNATPYGIYLLTNARLIDIWHNSVSMANGTGARAFYMTGGSGNDVRNNSFAVFGSTTGHAMYITQATYVSNVDYNNYYAPGSTGFVYIGAAYTTATYVGGGGFNTNSRNGDPMYISNTLNLHTTGAQLFDGGINLGVATDIDGDARPLPPSTLVDIGADEFNTLLLDAAVTSLSSPAVPFAAGVQNVSAVLFNYGSNTLTSATVNWEVNSVLQTPVAWTGSVSTYNSSSPVSLGNYTFASGSPYTIRVWTSNPNGSPDQDNANDTLTITLCTALNGTYTVGGVGADYATINDAVAALACGGVSGAVTMQLTAGAGPFNEQVIIPFIAGTSVTSPVRFTGGPTRETVTYAASTTTERAVIKINGAKNIILDSLTIINTGTTYGYGVQLTNSADSNIVRNCYVSVSTTATSSNFAGITLSGATVATNGDHGDDNLIENNTVNGGYYGISMRGTSSTDFNQRNKVIGNTLYNSYYYAVYVYYQEEPIVSGNRISQRPTATTAGYGIYMYYTNRFAVEGNDLDSLGGTGIYTYYGNYQGGTGTSRARIANNMVGGTWRDATSVYGIYITTNSRYLDIFHNSVSIDNADGRALYMTAGLQNDVRNNSFAMYNSPAGYAAYITQSTYVMDFNYNNFYAPGSSNFVYVGAAYTPATFVGGGGWNLNSINVNPYYTDPANDLHTNVGLLYDAGTNVGVNADIDGDPRPMAPSTGYDIGADEFMASMNDNSVVQILTPSYVGCADSNTVVTVVITNFGINPVTSVPLTAEISGYTSATMNTTYSGNLALGQSDTVVIGSFNSYPGGTLTLNVYSALTGDQNVTNDTLTGQLTVIPIAPVAVGMNDTTCLNTPAVLTVNSDGFAHTWFDAPVAGNMVGSGDTITTAPLTAPATFYVESRNMIPGSLTTTYAGGNGCDGTMFDIVPALDLRVDSFDVNIGSAVMETVRVFVCNLGSYAGNETNPGAWTLMGIVNVMAQGAGQPTTVPIGGIDMIAGQTYGICIQLTTSNMDYSTGSQSFSNADMTINTGAGLCAPFSSVNAGRIFNGSVYYNVQACPNPVRTPINVDVVAPPVVSLGNDTSTCVSFTLDAGNQGLNYLWSTAETTQQITVTASGQYAVAVSDPYCTTTDTINLSVNPNPVLTTSVADGSLCPGESDTMYVSGAMLYTWSSGGVGTMEIVTPSATTAYTVYGLDANGCTDTDTITIVVNPLPNVTLSIPNDTACFGGGPITLSGESPAGGTWSGNGVSGNTFDPNAAGLGSSVITYDYTDANGCSASANDNMLVDLCLDVTEVASAQMQLYPNPNAGEFTLTLAAAGETQITVYDALGQVISSERRTSGTYNMYIAAPGIYTVIAESEDGKQVVQRVIVRN